MQRPALLFVLLAVPLLLWFVLGRTADRDLADLPAEPATPHLAAEAGGPGDSALRAGSGAPDRGLEPAAGGRAPAGDRAGKSAAAPDSPPPRGSVRVRVEAENGAPLGSVFVRLQFRDDGGGGWQAKALRATDASTGEVRFRILGPEPSGTPEDLGWRVSLMILGAETPSREFSSRALPTETIVLVDPPHGAVEIDVQDLLDQRLAPGGTVYLNLAPAGLPDVSGDAPLQLPWNGAPVRFDRIGLGTELELGYWGSRSDVPTRLMLAGPQVNGELVESTLRVGADHPIVRLRLVDARGVPWTEQPVTVALEYESTGLYGGQFPGRTDDTGQLELELDAEWSSALLRIEQDERTARVELTGPLPGGVTDLGDVLFAPGPLIVAGRILGIAGEPLADVRIGVNLVQREPGEPAWSGGSKTDAAGAFVVSGWVEGRHFQLRASARGYVPRKIEFEYGAQDLTAVLVAAGSIAGTVLLEGDMPVGNLRVRATPRALLHGLEAGRMEARIEGRTFHVKPLAPGLYDVAVLLAGSAETDAPLALVEGVTVEAGRQADDARLLEIDLRGRLHQFPLAIEGYRGTGQFMGTIWLGEAGTGLRTASTLLQSERTVLTAPWPSIDLKLQVAGHRTVHLASVTGEVRVSLERGFPVRVVLRGDAKLPSAPYALGASLTPVGSKGYPVDFAAPHFDKRGELVVHVSEAGAVRLVWLIEQASTNGGDTMLVAADPEQVFVLTDSDVEQRVEVRLSSEELERLMERLGR